MEVGQNGCGPNAYLMGGICFCKPGYKKVNGQCVLSETYDVMQPLVSHNGIRMPTYQCCGSTECGTACETTGCCGDSCSLIPGSSCSTQPYAESSYPESSCSNKNCGKSQESGSYSENYHNSGYQGNYNQNYQENQDYQGVQNNGYSGG